MIVPPGYAVTGWAALRWWTGSRWFPGQDADGAACAVTVVTSTEHVRCQPGIAVSQEGVSRRHVAALDGVAVVRPDAALSFEVRRVASDLPTAIALVDMACFTDAVSLAEMGGLAHAQRGWTGVPRLRRTLELAVENSWSPQESWTRWRWVTETGLGAPLCNVPLFDLEGRHLATADLLDVEVGLVVEYDGAAHLGAHRRLGDVRREERLRDHGLEYLTTLAGDGGTAFVARLRAARSRAARHHVPRRWTVKPPPWWIPTDTVVRRRGLDQHQARRLLRYRSA